MQEPLSDERPLRIGIVGCGKVAAHHARFVSALGNARVVALADNNVAAAQNLAERHGIQDTYSCLEHLLDSTAIDVLHVATPPLTHRDSALMAMERGIHVFVEKPLAMTAAEVEQLYKRAAEKKVKLCPDYNQLFHPLTRKAHRLIHTGQLGRVLHVESLHGVDYTAPEFWEGQELHWSYRLPGGVIHNQITHPLYLVLYFTGPAHVTQVCPRSYGTLPQGLTDHSAMHVSGEHCTGTALVIPTRKPAPYFFRVFCEMGTVSVDFNSLSMTVTRTRGLLPGSLRRLTENLRLAAGLSVTALANVINYGRGRLVPYQGLQTLIPAFYSCIRLDTPPPVSEELTLAVTKAEEALATQGGKVRLDSVDIPSRQTDIRRPERILVTGGTGYVGTEVVRRLIQRGYRVRVLTRILARIADLQSLGVEIIRGDVRDLEAVQRAAASMDVVVHLAAALRGSPSYLRDCALLGTQNVAQAARSQGVARVIYMSSMSVYDFAQLRNGDRITEESPLEARPEMRGGYSAAKRLAEDEALAHLHDQAPAWTILRPSMIVGHGHSLLGPAGVKLGSVLVCLGRRNKNLRLVHVEDVAESIPRLLEFPETRSSIFTLSHPHALLMGEYAEHCLRGTRSGPRLFFFCPHWLAVAGTLILLLSRLILRRGPTMNFRRLAYLFRNVRANSDLLHARIGWQPDGDLLARLAKEARD